MPTLVKGPKEGGRRVITHVFGLQRSAEVVYVSFGEWNTTTNWRWNKAPNFAHHPPTLIWAIEWMTTIVRSPTVWTDETTNINSTTKIKIKHLIFDLKERPCNCSINTPGSAVAWWKGSYQRGGTWHFPWRRFQRTCGPAVCYRVVSWSNWLAWYVSWSNWLVWSCTLI